MLPPQQYCLRWKYHHNNLQTMFSQLLDRGCFCDVTLACEGQLIRAHRVVLGACSTFFDTVLSNYANERDPIIIMKDVTFAEVKCLIEFMYKGEINVEQSSLASLLKTADDLKIKGLAEVSYRDNEDDGIGPLLPMPAAELHSPPRGVSSSDYAQEAVLLHHQHQHHQQQLQRQQQQQHHNHLQQQQQQLLQQHAELEQRATTSAAAAAAAAAAVVEQTVGLPCMPTLTPRPQGHMSVTEATTSIEHYLGPKRKRGRPPLDDAYDVFNVRKLAQYGVGVGIDVEQRAFFESARQYNDEHIQQQHSASQLSPASAGSPPIAEYQQQPKKRLRQLQQQQYSDCESLADREVKTEWSSTRRDSGTEHVSESEEPHHNIMEESNNNANGLKDGEIEVDEPKSSAANKQQISTTTTPKRQEKRQQQQQQQCEITPERKERHGKLRHLRRSSSERTDVLPPEVELPKVKEELNATVAMQETLHEEEEQHAAATTHDADDDTDEAKLSDTTVPQPVEDMEAQAEDHVNATAATATPIATVGSSYSKKRTAAAAVAAAAAAAASQPTPPPPAPLTTSTASSSLHFSKFATVPEGYLINEHGILMTHDFVHGAGKVAIPSSTSSATLTTTTNGAAAGAAGHANAEHVADYMDIKMEDFDAAELRLTSEEMSQWQDVIKMDDYLAKGRRPQFWEETFTKRVLDAIKNKRLEMKKAARILGVSYGTLYGRYREVYGCLKHPYSGAAFRTSSGTAQLAVQQRFDLSFRNASVLAPPLELGKIRTKDLRELWTRPQI